MWRLPIQICGTVRRPLFCIISPRRAGSRSTRIFSMSVMRFCSSSRSADWQNGQVAVRYMTTFAMRGSGLFRRQAGLLPAGEAALEVEHFREAELAQGGDRLRRALAVVVVHDDRLLAPLGELRTRLELA